MAEEDRLFGLFNEARKDNGLIIMNEEAPGFGVHLELNGFIRKADIQASLYLGSFEPPEMQYQVDDWFQIYPDEMLKELPKMMGMPRQKEAE